MKPIDLGHGHTLRFVAWAPDRELNPKYNGIPDVERYAAVIEHPPGPHPQVAEWAAAGVCKGAVTFAGEVQRRIEPNKPVWEVESWDPLTISPSVLCSCGDHGFIREGRWCPA